MNPSLMITSLFEDHFLGCAFIMDFTVFFFVFVKDSCRGSK